MTERGETPTTDPDEQRRVGLCADCEHAERIMSSRRSVFYRCRYADVDPEFPRYPQLPVVVCRGHSAITKGGDG